MRSSENIEKFVYKDSSDEECDGDKMEENPERSCNFSKNEGSELSRSLSQ